jgi:histone H3/H4
MVICLADIPIAAVERILKQQGAKRVSKEAAKEFGSVLEDIAADIAAEAASLAKHAGRKTVLVADIKLAKRSI